MLADAAPDPATNNVPASNPPNKTLLNFISCAPYSGVNL